MGDSFIESLMNDYGDTLQGQLGQMSQNQLIRERPPPTRTTFAYSVTLNRMMFGSTWIPGPIVVEIVDDLMYRPFDEEGLAR